MSENTEQHIRIKFYQKLGKTGIETYEMLSQTFGDGSMSRTSVFEWHRRFRRQSMTIEERPGRTCISTKPEMVGKVRDMVMINRRITVRDQR